MTTPGLSLRPVGWIVHSNGTAKAVEIATVAENRAGWGERSMPTGRSMLMLTKRRGVWKPCTRYGSDSRDREVLPLYGARVNAITESDYNGRVLRSLEYCDGDAEGERDEGEEIIEWTPGTRRRCLIAVGSAVHVDLRAGVRVATHTDSKTSRRRREVEWKPDHLWLKGRVRTQRH